MVKLTYTLTRVEEHSIDCSDCANKIEELFKELLWFQCGNTIVLNKTYLDLLRGIRLGLHVAFLRQSSQVVDSLIYAIQKEGSITLRKID